jgi:two-component system NtrC family sensor kinase
VAIQVKDTGAGIPADVLPRVFDPFFTTKGPGQGTGLGLSQVYGFAKQSGGTVKLESTIGIGTTVTMYLPATEQAVETEGSVEPPSADIHSAKGTVLLVEDNEDVAMATEGLLSELGYDVEHVNSGTDALEKLQTGSYAFVLSDILMPGSIGGLELAGIVRDHHRDVQLLLTTGFSARAQQAVDEGYRILQKPFDLRALARAIEELKRERQAA